LSDTEEIDQTVRPIAPVKLLEMIVWHGEPIKPRIPLRVAYEVRAARRQAERGIRIGIRPVGPLARDAEGAAL
jgi:hypothetical protein